MAVTVSEAIEIVGNFVSGLPEAALSQLGETVNAIKEDMTEEGSPVTYPIIWDSPKQQAAFFASDGFGKGIPTGRTNDYVSGYVVNSIDHGFALANHSLSHGTEDHPAEFKAAAIGGFPGGEEWQSSIHQGRWLHLATVVSTEIVQLPKLLITNIRMLWNESINK